MVFSGDTKITLILLIYLYKKEEHIFYYFDLLLK